MANKDRSEIVIDQISNFVEQYSTKRGITFDKGLLEVRSRFPAIRGRLDLCSRYPMMWEAFSGDKATEKMKMEHQEFTAELDQLKALST